MKHPELVECPAPHTPCSHSVPQEDPTQKSRDEDGIIAYTWYHYLMEPDKPDYLLRLPMTKVSPLSTQFPIFVPGLVTFVISHSYSSSPC